jgi:hypothetical protein
VFCCVQPGISTGREWSVKCDNIAYHPVTGPGSEDGDTTEEDDLLQDDDRDFQCNVAPTDARGMSTRSSARLGRLAQTSVSCGRKSGPMKV